ncbi:GpW [Paraburkholderia tropica]
MAYTQADLDRLKRAIARGQLEVRYADRTIRYRSLDELMTVKREMERELAAASGATPRPRSTLVRSAGKGV